MSLRVLFCVNARVGRKIDKDFIQIFPDSESANEGGDSKCVPRPDLFV